MAAIYGLHMSILPRLRSLNLLPSISNMHRTNLHDLLKGKVFSNSNPIGLTDLETMHAITKEFLKAAITHMTGVPKAAGN